MALAGVLPRNPSHGMPRSQSSDGMVRDRGQRQERFRVHGGTIPDAGIDDPDFGIPSCGLDLLQPGRRRTYFQSLSEDRVGMGRKIRRSEAQMFETSASLSTRRNRTSSKQSLANSCLFPMRVASSSFEGFLSSQSCRIRRRISDSLEKQMVVIEAS